MFRNNRLQYLMHEATSNLSAAINTSSKAGAVVVVKVLLYIKFSSSMRAASSEALILRETCLCSDSLIPFEKSCISKYIPVSKYIFGKKKSNVPYKEESSSSTL
ncbi:hypothetical protein V8G54_009360 [Vigna mungo]|uniref:Uncharacterized protein n=1 Tax=Vigna mungo TaxID=3915 RepID=A0AAQ3NVM9_VIGMU